MALTREKKETVVDELEQLLSSSKLTVLARYQGTPVKAMQLLRAQSALEGTLVMVAKNRLFKRALESSEIYKGIDTKQINGQLLYAFNSTDEVAPARSLAEFAKTNPQIEFVAGLSAEGELLDVAAVKSLSALPTKDVLRAQLIGTIGAPVSSFVGVLTANVRGILNVLSARAEALGE